MDHLALLAGLTGKFAEELEHGHLDAPIAACPGWTLADLGEHLRSIHLWTAHAVTEGSPDGTPAPGSLERDELVDGYRRAAGHLVDVLASTPEDAPTWAFGPKPHVAAFWRRRQVHETSVHLYDALAAGHRAASWSPAPDVAWDGVDEVATVFYPRLVRQERTTPVAGTLRLTATDLDGLPIDLGDRDPVVEVHDTAGALLLTLWQRRAAPQVAAHLMAGAEFTP